MEKHEKENNIEPLLNRVVTLFDKVITILDSLVSTVKSIVIIQAIILFCLFIIFIKTFIIDEIDVYLQSITLFKNLSEGWRIFISSIPAGILIGVVTKITLDSIDSTKESIKKLIISEK